MALRVRRLAAGAALALATTSLTGALPTAAQAAPVAPNVRLGNYTCVWSLNLHKDSATHWTVDIPVACNGVMDSIQINAQGWNPSDHVNWDISHTCTKVDKCELGTAADQFDAQVVACVRVQIRAAVAVDCQGKPVK